MKTLRNILLAACIALGGPAFAVGPEITVLKDNPDYVRAVQQIEAQSYGAAIPTLMALRREYPAAPEVSNWLGFAHRKLKDYPTSKRFYDEALMLDPNYLPALEYQGEWFIETGDIASARANLAKLERLCGRCHEWDDLAKSLAQVKVQ